MGGLQHQESRLRSRQRRHPYARRILDLRLGDRAHACRYRICADLGRLSRAAAWHLSVAQTQARRAGLSLGSIVIARSGATKQSRLLSWTLPGLLRFARNDGIRLCAQELKAI